MQLKLKVQYREPCQNKYKSKTISTKNFVIAQNWDFSCQTAKSKSYNQERADSLTITIVLQ